MAEIERTGGHPVHVAHTGADIPHIAKNLSAHMDRFARLLPPSPDNHELEHFAHETLALDKASRNALPAVQNPSSRLMEDVQDAATTAQTILNQPLSIPGASSPDITLVTASQNLVEKHDPSDLQHIAKTFHNYSESTASMKLELEQTVDALNKK